MNAVGTDAGIRDPGVCGSRVRQRKGSRERKERGERGKDHGTNLSKVVVNAVDDGALLNHLLVTAQKAQTHKEMISWGLVRFESDTRVLAWWDFTQTCRVQVGDRGQRKEQG